MEAKTLTKLTYGMFIASTKKGNKTAGCIIDTCMQVATAPDRILISVMNGNYTRKLIKESGHFCVTILDETCPFAVIKHFGYQSSKDVDKFVDIPFFEIEGIPCPMDHACGVIYAKVAESVNLGSHTIFIGKIKDLKLLNNKKPLTYLRYQEELKPQNSSESESMPAPNATATDKTVEIDERKIIAWQCTVCGYVHETPDMPDDFICPQCGHPKEDFEPIYEDEKT